MVRLSSFRFFIILICFFLQANAQSTSFNESFKQRLESYQSNAYDKALSFFELALAAQPKNTAALYNKGLACYKLGQKGLAIGLFRQVLFIDPGHEEAKAALSFALTQLNPKEIPHQLETYEIMREQILSQLSTRTFLALSALMLLVIGWLLISWLGARKRAHALEESPKGFPLYLAFLSLFGLAVFGLSSLKVYDSFTPRGTILPEQVQGLTAPAEGATNSITLYQGFEVIIKKAHEDWLQVTYPGAQTGWVQKKAVLLEQLN
jgi:tetratricopeptide (TPR) repeat protein